LHFKLARMREPCVDRKQMLVSLGDHFLYARA